MTARSTAPTDRSELLGVTEPAGPASWLTRHNVVLTGTAACVAPVLYLLFVNHYTSNALLFDDWRMVPFVNAALHGDLSLGQLWSQYGEPRLPLVRLDLLFFAQTVQLNTRWAVFLSAGIVIAGYAFLLALFWRYLGRPLTPIPVLIVGIIWFSLANVQGALLSTSNGIFVVFGFVAMLFALIVPRRHRTLWIGVAIIAAWFSCLGAVQGFIVWPIGATYILWSRRPERQKRIDLGVWVSAFVLILGLYFIGYNSHLTSCIPDLGCVPTSALHNPSTAVRYFLVLVGNVIPGAFTSSQPGTYFGPRPTSFIRYEMVGAVLLAAGAFILVQSWRRRTTSESLPLPFLLIAFAVLYDASITWGRVGEGLAGPVVENRYALPNLVLLVGVTIYAWAHIPPLGAFSFRGGAKYRATLVSLIALGVFIGAQAAVATSVGLTAARNTQTYQIDGARLVTNLDRVPHQYRVCELTRYLIPDGDVRDAAQDHLGEFSPAVYRHYRALGPPPLLPACTSVP
jgi:hypothetical protein